MRLVTNEGTYRGKVLEWGLSLSSGGYPQFVVQCSAEEYYDEESGEWQPWAEYDEGATAYLVLAGKEDKPTKNAEQVKKIFDWDGVSGIALDQGDYSNTKIQFRVDLREYEGKERKQVNWVDVYDAVPKTGLGTVEKLDESKLKAIEAKFAGVFKSLSGGKVPTAKAPSSKKATPPKKRGKAAKQEAEAPAEPADSNESNAAPAPPVPPKRTAPPKRQTAAAPPKQYTQQSAWDEVISMTKMIDDGERAEAWSRIIEEVVPGKDDTQITDDEWASIVKYVVKDLTQD